MNGSEFAGKLQSMITRERYAQHSPYTDPGAYSALLDSLPTDIHELTAVARNVIVHYRSGTAFTDNRLAEIDNRWVENILATDQQRFPTSLDVPRPQPDRVAGCCRDFTLLTVAALRHRGVPARSRVGFSRYLGGDGFHNDHVIVEYWNGERWVFVDSQLEPGPDWPFDTHDIPRLVGTNPSATPYFWTAAQAWTGFRSGAIDVDQYGSEPDSRLQPSCWRPMTATTPPRLSWRTVMPPMIGCIPGQRFAASRRPALTTR